MFLRFLLLIGFMLLTIGCRHSSEVSNVPSREISQQGKQQVLRLADFTRVKVSGVMNVSLHTGYKQPKVVLRGDSRDLASIAVGVRNGQLFVAMGANQPNFGPVQVEIDSRYLNSFEYRGRGIITGSKLHTGLFDLVLENQGKTTLGGQIGLRKLEVKGNGPTEISGINSPYMVLNISGKSSIKLSGIANVSTLNVTKEGRLSLYWVKSRDLTIRGRGKSFIQLAGVVDKLNVELWDSARFNGRYLRAMRAFVKTYDLSVAEISAVKRQHTLASNKSDIHFYNIPAMKADFMADAGATLDMRDLRAPFLQEYDQYNK